MSKKTKSNPVDLSNFEDLFDEILSRVVDATGVADEADLTLPDNPVSVGSRVPDADAWADKMVDRAVSASGDWLTGVLSPRKHPIEAAIAADGKRKQRLEEAEREGRWKAAMQRVNVDEMYSTIEAVGQSAYTAGLEARRGKVKSKIAKLQPLVKTLAETIDKMPQDTDTQREQKMLAAKRGMQAIGKKLRGIT